jgi:hypothetical protein
MGADLGLMHSVGKRSADTLPGDEAICDYYLYMLAKVEPGEYSELGEVEFVLADGPLKPPPKTAAVRLCRAEASTSWLSSVRDSVTDWLGPPCTRKNCCLKSWADPNSHKHGSRQLCRWQVCATPGKVWTSYSSMVSDKVGTLLSGTSDNRMVHLMKESRALLVDLADPVQSYYSMLKDSGYYDIPEPPLNGGYARAGHAKRLHTIESEEVLRMLDILKKTHGYANLDSRRIVDLDEVNDSCSIM